MHLCVCVTVCEYICVCVCVHVCVGVCVKQQGQLPLAATVTALQVTRALQRPQTSVMLASASRGKEEIPAPRVPEGPQI